MWFPSYGKAKLLTKGLSLASPVSTRDILNLTGMYGTELWTLLPVLYIRLIYI